MEMNTILISQKFLSKRLEIKFCTKLLNIVIAIIVARGETMTDKELAEEYRKHLKQRLIDEDDFERLENFDENVEEAFLAGLKLGRQQS